MPRRQLTLRHGTVSSIACADTEMMSGIAFLRGRPRPATGKIIAKNLHGADLKALVESLFPDVADPRK